MRWRFNCISCSYFFDFPPIQPCDGFLIAGTATISRFWPFWLGIVARNTAIDLELKFCTPQFRNSAINLLTADIHLLHLVKRSNWCRLRVSTATCCTKLSKSGTKRASTSYVWPVDALFVLLELYRLMVQPSTKNALYSRKLRATAP